MIWALLLLAVTPPVQVLDQSRADLEAGRYAEAISHARSAVAEFRSTHDRKNLAASLRVLGLARLYSGLYEPASESLTEALALARQLHDFGSEIARLNELGTTAYFQGRYRQALDRFEEARARVGEVPNDERSPWARQVSTANVAMLYQTLGQFDRTLTLYSGLLENSAALTPAEQAQLLSNIGALRRRLGDPVKALETYRQAQALYAKGDGRIAVLNNIGILQATDLGDPRGAENSFTEALALARKGGHRPLALQAQLYRGEARYRAGQTATSEADLHEALSLARALGQKEEEWRALFGLGRSTHSRPLLMQAASVVESLRAGAGSSQLRSTFLADKRAVYDLLVETSETPEEAFRWMEQSRARTPGDRSRQPAQAPPRDTAVLEFWIGSKSALVWWLSSKGSGMKRWQPDFAALARANELLSDPHRTDWRAVLQPIAHAMLQGVPVLNDPSIHRLRIIPDGPLTLLPFEALPWNDGKLLIERFAVSYAPAARPLRAHQSRAFVRWPWQLSVMAIADPQAGAATEDDIERRAWAPLPHARTEAAEVARAIGGRTEVHTGADATKTRIAAAYPILHFATHAQADLQDPDRSFILFAPASPKTQQYDYLFSKEVPAYKFENADLVTLSACETQRGAFVPGEGLRGFSEAFLGAGARSVLNSLWSVGDASTEELMTRFYQRLSKGDTAADALRAAKLDFIAHRESSHPAHWAGFVLNGDADWTLPSLIGWPWFAVAALAVLSAAYLKLR